MNAADEVLQPALQAGLGASTALHIGSRKVSYDALFAATNQAGNAFTQLGVEAEHRVLMLLRDSEDFVACYLGAMRMGAVPVALNLRLSTSEVAYVVNDSRCKVLVMDEEFNPLLEAAEPHLTHTPTVVIRRTQPSAHPSLGTTAPARGLLTLDTLLRSASKALRPAVMSPDDMAFWIYTSGTTGTPKAAVHLQHDVLHADTYLREVLSVTAQDRLFATSKLFFAYALGTCLLGSLRIGASTVLLDAWPDPQSVRATIAQTAPTVVFAVPSMFRNLHRSGVTQDPAMQVVRAYVSAGERLPAQLAHTWESATSVPIFDGMGTTETTYMIFANGPKANRVGTAGKVCPNTTVELRSPENDAPIKTVRTPGVLWVQSPSTCDRYWNQQARSRAAIKGEWLCTGDLFEFDEDGYYTHLGRADDMLKISGQWVSPMEIEDALPEDLVNEAAVVGIPNEDGLTRLALFVVPRDSHADEQTLAARLQETLLAKLSAYKCPRDIRVVLELPRTATGKVQRHKLREIS